MVKPVPVSMASRMVVWMRSTDGMARSSSDAAEGSGMCGVVILTLGPSRSQKASSATIDAISAPQPQRRGFSSTVKKRPVFVTDRQDRPGVERDQGADVDDLGGDAVVGEPLGRFECPGHHEGEGGDRAVAPLPDHTGRRPGCPTISPSGISALRGHQRLVLEEDTGSGSRIEAAMRPDDVLRAWRGRPP